MCMHHMYSQHDKAHVTINVTVTEHIQLLYFGPIRMIIRWSQHVGVDKAFQAVWNLPSTSVDPVFTSISALISTIDTKRRTCHKERVVTSERTQLGLERQTMH
jgi:hypothetical protein